MAYAHSNLMAAWKNPTVVYTSPPCVEKIEYIEPTADEVDVDKIILYRTKVLSALGISFLTSDKSQTASTAKMSLSQLMLCINSISEEIENVLNHWYETILIENGIDLEFCPMIKIIDSEKLDFDLRQSLASLLFSSMNCSYDTCLSILGFDVKDEVQKRIYENENNYEQIFTGHASSYTSSSSSNNVGRPADRDSNDPDKQEYDANYERS